VLLWFAATFEIRRSIPRPSVVDTWYRHALLSGLFLSSEVGLSFLLAFLYLGLLPGLLFEVA
jgi:hypothetical protein